MSHRNPLLDMALIFVACILIIVASGAGVVLKFHQARVDAEQAGAMFDVVDDAIADTIFIREGDLYQETFREPFELVLFLFRDGTFYIFTTKHDRSVVAPIWWIVEYIENAGKKLEDCLLVIHNHFTPLGFSESDLRTWKYLARRGFKGEFGIYYPATGNTRWAGDK